ncbi:putative Patatin family phospholipase [Aspergillus affinis]|uniref:putative Patatin family phospholipase n=1 Tax=Aspergillus affinis TaxID=1070780 RepID=UPI0022FE89BC|nr:putative patatin family phospholipase [Aspergillus affinis]KAI9042642.1 putative patatin family phospholipase [Aspergillus affinis]
MSDLSLFPDRALVRPHCHGKARHTSKPKPAALSQRDSLLKRTSLPSLSSVVKGSLTWAGDRLYGTSEADRSKENRNGLTETETRRQSLYFKMRTAVLYEEWKDCASKLDVLEDHESWKNTFESTEYDACLIQERLKQLEDARASSDVSRMLFLIRTSLSRDLGNMSNPALYSHSHAGTKLLIDRYITEAVETISTLAELSGKDRCDGLELRYILDQLLAARQAFGRSALLFSGGGTFGMNHIGVLKSLWQANLLPRIMSGASAGSIVCSVFCTRTEEEIPELLDNFAYGDFDVFGEDDGTESILQMISRILKHGTFMDIQHLAKFMRGWLGDITFQEAYNRTRRILNICVSSAGIYELPRLLNYITAPNVCIWSAVAVSCSVPLVFQPYDLMAKDPQTGEVVPWYDFCRQYIDGSVDGDLPMTRLSEMFNVNHFIVSQVNPHIIPFLPKSVDPKETKSPSRTFNWVQSATQLAKDELLHRMMVMAEMGIFPTSLSKAISIVNQKYSGDINIYPDVPYNHFPLILKNPTTEFMLEACLSGERATWPKVREIRNHCAIELALDSAIQKMRTRVTFSRSQVDLRTLHLVERHSENLDRNGARRAVLNRRSSYSHEVEKAQKTQMNAARAMRPELRRTCSAVSSSASPDMSTDHEIEPEHERHAESPQSYVPSASDESSLADSDDDDEPLLPSLQRPGLIQHPASWEPMTTDCPVHWPVSPHTFYSRRLSTGALTRHSSHLTDPPPSLDQTPSTKSMSPAQNHLLRMTPSKAAGTPYTPFHYIKN